MESLEAAGLGLQRYTLINGRMNGFHLLFIDIIGTCRLLGVEYVCRCVCLVHTGWDVLCCCAKVDLEILT